MQLVLEGLLRWGHILLMGDDSSRVPQRSAEQPNTAASGRNLMPAPLAFEDWYERDSARLVAVISLAAGDRELGAELVAEACARAWEKWGRVSKMANPSGWTYRVAVNLLKRKKRREAMERNLLRRQRIENVPPPGDPASEIWRAVAGLSERQRMMVGLRYVEDLSEPQIAEIMGVATGTVGATLSQARSKLRSQVADPNERSA